FRRVTGKLGAAVVHDSKRTKPWAEAVSWAAKAALQGRSFGASPVMVYLDFVMPRPKGHLGTGKNAGQVRAGAPGIPTTKPDIDKLARLVLDALTGLEDE